MIRKRHIDGVLFQKEQLILLVDNKRLAFNLDKISPKLKKADKKERETYEISPSGYGIHWPLLDEDLSIESLLKSHPRESSANRP
jgi:hypothetical protein